MITDYNWYKIINKTEFEALDLTSRSVDLVLEDIGLKTFLVCKGNLVSILVDEVYLCAEMNDTNPFEFGDNAIWVDPDTDDIYYGVLIED